MEAHRPHDEVLHELLDAQREQELSIIKISEPITTALGAAGNGGSEDVIEAPTPASLEADLAHYKELFSKLRFSYVEQVTKEKFIRAIVSDPPQVIEYQENVELEFKLVAEKAALKAQKSEVADMIEELDKLGRDLSRKHNSIEVQTIQLQQLPKQIEGLQSSIARLKAAQAPGSNPLLNMSLERTLATIADKEKENAELSRQLEQLQSSLPRKTRELERLEAEMQPLEVKRLGTTASAREAQKRKEAALNGAGDDLEERGRWWRGVDAGLKGLLGVEA